MHRWSFNLQVYFLHHRFASIIDIENSHKGFVQDRTIYEDVEIFLKIYMIWVIWMIEIGNLFRFIFKYDKVFEIS